MQSLRGSERDRDALPMSVPTASRGRTNPLPELESLPSNARASDAVSSAEARERSRSRDYYGERSESELR